jgi:hypothetical protein
MPFQISFGKLYYGVSIGQYEDEYSVLDKTPMFTVFSKRDGKTYSHHVKPLQIIWNHLPQL